MNSEHIGKPFILVVEDDHHSQLLLKFFLRDKYDLCFVVSVGEALKCLEERDVDLILVDLSLEGDEDGLDLVRWMRKQERWKNTPVIATTAHALTKDRDNCYAAGCDDYLAKPIMRDRLEASIYRHLHPDS